MNAIGERLGNWGRADHAADLVEDGRFGAAELVLEELEKVRNAAGGGGGGGGTLQLRLLRVGVAVVLVVVVAVVLVVLLLRLRWLNKPGLQTMIP